MSENQANLRSDLKKDGYSKEEEYFYRVNQELIESRRKILDSKRQAQSADHQGSAHWMTCPKCGHPMSLVNLLGIQVEKCTKCEGVYFDRAEIETLLEAQEHKHFLSALWKLLKGTLSKTDSKWTP